MGVRTELTIRGGDRPFELAIEPWGNVVIVSPGDDCRLVAVHDTEPAAFSVAHHPEYLTVWGETGGTTYEVWRNGRRAA